MSCVMGIDPSTVTGMVVFNDGVTYHVEKQFKKLTGIERADAFLGWISGELEFHKPDCVFIEGYGFGNAHTLAILVEVGTAIRLALHAHGLKYVEVAPTQLKKYALGKGVGKKEEIMLAVYKKWSFSSPTNNIADAYVLAKMAQAYWSPSDLLTSYQEDVLAKIRSSH